MSRDEEESAGGGPFGAAYGTPTPFDGHPAGSAPSRHPRVRLRELVAYLRRRLAGR